MPTVRDIINQALVMCRVLASGDTASADEASDGLFVVQGMYEAMVADGGFGTLKNVRVTADYEAAPGDRVYVDGAFTVTLPDTIEVDGEDVRPVDLSCVEVIESDPAIVRTAYVYEAAVGDWVALTGLTLDSEAPLATRGRDGLALLVAMYFADQFADATLTRMQLMRARQFKGSIIGKMATRVREPEYF